MIFGEVIGIAGVIGLPQRRIDDHLFLDRMLAAYLSFASNAVRWPVWLSSVVSILSKIASVISCSVLSASNQSPAAALVIWTKSLRPMLAARPTAAPATAAPIRTPELLFPQSHSLSLFDWLLFFEPVFVSVVVAIWDLLILPLQTSGLGTMFRVRLARAQPGEILKVSPGRSETGHGGTAPGRGIDPAQPPFRTKAEEEHRMNNRHERDARGAIGAILGIMMVGLLVAAALAKQRSRKDRESRDHGNRGGFVDRAAPARGAMSDFKMPEDMRAVIPEPPSYAPA